jgi:hypothetical protein
MRRIVLTFFILLPSMLLAQQDLFYYHTIHSSSLSAMYGRTVKAHYSYQVSHRRQLQVSGLFVNDDYSQNSNRIKADLYNVNVQFLYNLIHKKKLFIGMRVGLGGYLLNAKDLIGIKQKERNVNAVGGLQGEFYVWRNNLAILFDYDILYMPFSDLYEFLHVPTGGLGIYF